MPDKSPSDPPGIKRVLNKVCTLRAVDRPNARLSNLEKLWLEGDLAGKSGKKVCIGVLVLLWQDRAYGRQLSALGHVDNDSRLMMKESEIEDSLLKICRDYNDTSFSGNITHIDFQWHSGHIRKTYGCESRPLATSAAVESLREEVQKIRVELTARDRGR